MDVREQSHKNEMAAALRGDFQRLRDRGVATTLGHDEITPSAVAATAPREADAPAAPARVVIATDPAATAPAVAPVELVARVAVAADETAPSKPSFVSRLLGRS